MAICGHGIAVTIKKPLISPQTECRPESSKIIDPRYDVHTIMDDILVRLSEFKVENVFTLERLERSDLDSILTSQAKTSNVTTSSDCSTLTVLLLLGLTLHNTWILLGQDREEAGQDYQTCIDSGPGGAQEQDRDITPCRSLRLHCRQRFT